MRLTPGTLAAPPVSGVAHAPTEAEAIVAPMTHGPSEPSPPLFRPLHGSARSMSEEEIADHQRARLFLSMIAAVAHEGYASVRITEVTRLAAVSNSTFYAHFSSKEECFFATCEEIVSVGADRVSIAYEEAGGDWRNRIRAGFSVFLATLAEEPDAARLVLVDSLALGPRGVEQRRKAMDPFEDVLRRSLAESPASGRMADTTMHAIIAGTLQLVYRMLRHGQADQLEGLTDTLVDWVVTYQTAAAVAPLPEPSTAEPDAPRPSSPLDDPETRFTLPPRARIELAITMLVERGGYQALSMPAISGLAAVSNQTFYKHFSGKEDAFLATFDEITEGARKAAAIPFEAAPDWPSAVCDGLDALLEFLGRESLMAPLPLMGIYTGPPAALDRADAILDLFRLFFLPAIEQAPETGALTADAIAGGLWHLIQEHVADDHRRPLHTLAPQLAYLALVPFLGAQETVEAIERMQR